MAVPPHVHPPLRLLVPGAAAGLKEIAEVCEGSVEWPCPTVDLERSGWAVNVDVPSTLVFVVTRPRYRSNSADPRALGAAFSGLPSTRKRLRARHAGILCRWGALPSGTHENPTSPSRALPMALTMMGDITNRADNGLTLSSS